MGQSYDSASPIQQIIQVLQVAFLLLSKEHLFVSYILKRTEVSGMTLLRAQLVSVKGDFEDLLVEEQPHIPADPLLF